MDNLISSQVTNYKLNGYTIFKNVIDNHLLQEASEHVSWLIKKNPDLRPEQLHHHLITDDPFWVRLISDVRLLNIVEAFIGQNIALYASHYICKPPCDGLPVLWHQDGSYWPLEPMEVVSLWLAIDDSVIENGCMRLIPGTQNMKLQKLEKITERPNVLNSQINPDLIDESKAVDIILKSGDVSVHNPNIIHGSSANVSKMRRCGLTIRYIPTTTRIKHDEEKFRSAFLLRGNAIEGINQYNDWPIYKKTKHMPFRGCEKWAH